MSEKMSSTANGAEEIAKTSKTKAEKTSKTKAEKTSKTKAEKTTEAKVEKTAKESEIRASVEKAEENAFEAGTSGKTVKDSTEPETGKKPSEPETGKKASTEPETGKKASEDGAGGKTVNASSKTKAGGKTVKDSSEIGAGEKSSEDGDGKGVSAWENGKISAATEVSTSELAVVLGITARYVRQLTEDGRLRKSGRGRYPLAESVQAYVSMKRDDDLDDDDEATKKKDKKTERLKRESEAKYKAAKAAIAEMDAEERKGKMHRSEDVAAMTADLIFAMRGVLIALPGRLAVDMIGIEDAAVASDIIRREVNLAMEELAEYEYNPAKYQERVRERLKLEAELKSGEDDA